MTDKIVGQGPRSVVDTATVKRSGAPEAKPAAGGESATQLRGTETVSLTNSGRLLSQLEELAEAAPAGSSDRIAALKQAIESGRYAIDAESIADRMIRLERELG
jgi:negative regulator of flagellin synthesis FlgM